MGVRIAKLIGLGVALVLLAGAVGDSGHTGWAAQHCDVILNPGSSIQQAIDSASSGDVICLQAGTWEENIVIKKSLTLQGAGADSTIIQGAREGYPVVWVEGSAEATLEDLTVTGAFGRCAGEGPKLICPSGLWVQGRARVTLHDSTVSRNWAYGLYVGRSARVTLQNSQVSDNGGWGGLMVGDSAQVTLQNSQVSGNGDDGLNVWSSAQVTLQNSQVSGNGGDGLYVWGSAQVTLQNSQVSGNEWAGLVVWGSARVTGEGSLIEGNGADENCRRTDRFCNGLMVAEKAHVELRNTTIRNNTDWGIAAWLKKCGYLWDDFKGMVLWEGRGNTIEGNGQGDVCLP